MNLELGNATPVIVAADADLDDVATRLAANAFSFAGQSCISVQRIYVERSAYDAFLERFLPRVEALVVGDPADDATDVGPLIAMSERDRVLEWIEEATSRGARVLAGGTLDGELLRPTVIVDAPRRLPRSHARRSSAPSARSRRSSRSTRRSRLRTARASGSRPGSSPATSRPRSGRRRELEFGGVTINEAPTFRADQMPYGGVKDSGNTREGPAYAVREMTEERLVVLQL